MYVDRMEAGELLAVAIEKLPQSPTLIVAISESSTAVARPLAETLNLPMGLMLISPMFHPSDRSKELGALCETGTTLWNSKVHEPNELMRFRAKKQARKHLDEARQAACFELIIPDVEGERVLLVSDGVTSPTPFKLAIEVTRRRGAKQAWAATPVGDSESLRELHSLTEYVVCLVEAKGLESVDSHYF